MAMFGLLASGRMVQTNFDRVGEKQFLITIPEADSINHVVVFLTGAVAFPDGFGGLVYFSWPNSNAPPNWCLLGVITNEKPSSIFKISNLKKDSQPSLQESGFLAFAQTKISHVAQIGISIETADVVQQQHMLLNAETTKNQTQFVEFTQKMLESFFNYSASFVLTPSPNEAYVPMKVVEDWYKNFERKLALNPYFWRSSA
ncbi:protein OPI10 homolog [Cimex lectularius]|uniref:Hikeshi-like domain-containing protein n=1 Tax=Cimex lectularius TaxID=79782 RepID=A0A8I6TEK2_CIMLE|nr:protein OPI10 homolog [Cimex lectularius]